MKHIVHVVESLAAGVLSIVVDIANQQVQDGQKVTLVYSTRSETPANWRELFAPEIECYFLTMGRAIHPVRDMQAVLGLWRLLKRLRPDVVHLHSSKAGAVGRLTSLVYRQPRYFFSPHGLSFLQSGGNRLQQQVFLGLEKILAGCPATLIACSASEAEEIRRHLTKRVVVVENAVDGKVIPVKSTVNPRIRVGSVGRICTQKNPEAFARLAQACRTLPVDFVWIGAGEPKHEAALREAGVTVTGWMSRTEVLNTLSQWDVYVQTSRWEGMPVAVIEAMLAGLPVIVSNVTGNRDVVIPGETGWIADTHEEFVACLRTLLLQPDKIQQMGMAGRNFALSRFSITHMTQALYNVYGFSA